LMMVDMDAPAKGKDKNKNYLHWLTVNMPYDDVARSNLVQKYTPPNPPKGSGKHRYVILAFQQGGKIDHKELQKHLKDGPASFSLNQLLAVAAHAGSSKYPTLEAGTFFTCEAGDAGVDLSKDPSATAHKKTSSISIMTGDGKAVNLSNVSSPQSKAATPKSGVSPISRGGSRVVTPKQGTPRAAAAGTGAKGAQQGATKKQTDAMTSKMRHMSV